MNLHIEPLDDWQMTCPCGARSEHAYGVCRKCRHRAAWLRRRARRGWAARPDNTHTADQNGQEGNG